MRTIFFLIAALGLVGCGGAEFGDECTVDEDCEDLEGDGEAVCYINSASGSSDGYCTFLCDTAAMGTVDTAIERDCTEVSGTCDGQLVTRGESRAFCRK